MELDNVLLVQTNLHFDQNSTYSTLDYGAIYLFGPHTFVYI